MQLEEHLRKQLEKKDILLMTHLVLGYPSFDANREVIRQMVENGVDCIEMQIPFSEPMADGPVIMKASLSSLEKGTTVAQCLAFGQEMAATYQIPFLYMTYYNIVFKYGEANFINTCKETGIRGLIVPDLPPEQSETFYSLCAEQEICPILIYAPTSTDKRMHELDAAGAGFIYCAARKGVTGKKTNLEGDFSDYIARCRKATQKPLAVGFGISCKEDIDTLRGHADMAVIGSETIRLVDKHGTSAVASFIAGLR